MSRVFLKVAALLGVACAGWAAECVVQPGSVLRIVLAPGTKMSPKPEAILAGSLGRPVYSENCQAVGQGAGVRAVVGRVNRGGAGQVMLGWIKLLAGAERKAPSVTLRSVEIEAAGLGFVPVPALFLRMEKDRRLTASAKAQPKSERRRMLLLEVDEPVSVPATAQALRPAGNTVPAGTSVRIDMLTPLSTAKNRDGDLVRARVVEPVIVGGQEVLPVGTVIEGVVAQSKRARRPYRSGRMRLSFRSLRLAGGQPAEIVVTMTAGEFANATRLDEEGELTGGALNRKQALLNVGVAYLTGKILDDLIEEGAKAALGAAVAGSAATAARYVGLGVGTFFFLMHRGREVSVASQTEMQLTFVREARIQP